MKSTKEAIVSKLNTSTPPPLEYITPSTKYDDVLEVFEQNALKAGAKLYRDKDISQIYPNLKNVVDTRYEHSNQIDNLNECELLILYPSLAIAQNGAIWIEPTSYPKELITLTQHIAIVLNSKDRVSNMKEGYDRIDFTDISTGLFISGPSKTADIEQALVIGAHGAISLSIFIQE